MFLSMIHARRRAPSSASANAFVMHGANARNALHVPTCCQGVVSGSLVRGASAGEVVTV